MTHRLFHLKHLQKLSTNLARSAITDKYVQNQVLKKLNQYQPQTKYERNKIETIKKLIQ